ncbi:MAG TPA: ATP-dependent DNA helicase RecG [Methylomirabilota bacterium]|nr:ATP-dependent DNA helicase RecG [Methylomirabilota bacterium]
MSPPENKISSLKMPITSLWGVGAERAAQLARLEIFTIEDLLLHRPKRCEDRRHFRKISELTKDEPFTARGKIVALGLKRFRGGGKSVFEIILDDGSARLHCRWWNLPFMENYFAMGDEVFVFGKLKETKPRTMDHPETEVIEGGEESFIHINRIAPIYPLTEGLPQRWLRGLIWRTLEKFVAAPRQSAANFPEWNKFDARIAALCRDAATLPSRANAVHMIHFPEELSDTEIARQRLALDEFIGLQLEMQSRRKKFESNAKALPCGGDNRLMKPFLSRLGFKLTESQTKVLREIRHDMSGSHPMRRLLQGDVGSGKTAVAACSALMAIESGFNVALMAPTEILAEQHFRNFSNWFEPLGVKVELQTGSRKIVQSPKSKVQSLFIGTHALIESDFAIENLGLVIVDEQHKFGVAQRETLVRKGNYPHLLVMTATPIPRTLGLTLYGDLDVSTISEMPAGRGKIKTFVRMVDKLPKVFEFIREKISGGRQAYVVYPRVEDSGAKELKAVVTEFENLKKLLAPFRVGLLHGRLKSAEKENVMADFRANKIQILLSTSLIEVGVDVPNATVMLIENAEQFGLAQLHQLRGRIGRGAHESFCILISDAKNLEARERLKILEETNDGFKIAEADLKLRGPGELLGREQSGLPKFRFGNLAEDLDLIRQARELVSKNFTAETPRRGEFCFGFLSETIKLTV